MLLEEETTCTTHMEGTTANSKLGQLREVFYNSALQEDKTPLKKNLTERAKRDSGITECSTESGLSSPTSNTSQDLCDTTPSQKPWRLTRHHSASHIDNYKLSYTTNITELQTEAQDVQRAVDDLTSTKTMRRRRTESSQLTVTDRRQRATESISSYTPVAPIESEWGMMFDEMIARLKGYEHDANEAHIFDDSIDCVRSNNSNLISDTTETDNLDKVNDKCEANHTGGELVNNNVGSVELHKIETNGRKHHSDSQLSQNRRRKQPVQPSNQDVNTLMRSISFHRPDIATYNMPLCSLRRTDSGNDVWIERKGTNEHQIARTNVDSKKHEGWKKFTRFLSFPKKRKS